MRGLRKTASFIGSHWRPHGRRVPLLLGLTAASALLLAVSPLILGSIVDGILAGLSVQRLASGVSALAVVAIVQLAASWALIRGRVRMNLTFDHAVRQRAAEHLLWAPPESLGSYRTGDLVARLTDDVSDKLAWFMCSGVFRLVEAAFVIGLGGLMMARLDPVLALCAAGPLPLLAIVWALTAARLERSSEEVQDAISKESAALESLISGIRVVKAFAAEPMQRQLLGETVERQRRAEMRSVRWQALVDTLYGHLWQLGIVGVLLVGGAAAASRQVSLGTLLAFDAWVVMLVQPMVDIAQFLVRGRQSAVNVGRISELEAKPGGDTTATLEPEAPTRSLAVSFEAVVHRYPGASRDSLSALSFQAPAGRLTAITGPVGSGKSTLLALVVRLLEPRAGSVRVGGWNVRHLDPAALRRAVALVSQDPMLLSTTILENITLGRPWVGPADVSMAVEAACIEEDIAAFPEGIHTRVGTRGVRLSGGQKQRVALARAIAGRPAVLLLDDVTASLDAATEERVWAALDRVLPGITTIVVTHREATLARASRVSALT